ncbi:hypothetical protein LQ384_09915 [Rhodococcus rhodochrous]|uniref:Uncharacterized protein n=1 Tax=Rhodococcus rhodochrous TaxID=1829 RepID=A0AAW4XEH7_RHORH|nr:hypothetical protein [Rhodococcus rhodochrous]MCD2111411.1 hypothetical protein [Rhodococcus rhodochrous]
MTSNQTADAANDYYAGFLEGHVGKDKAVTIKTIAGTETNALVERVSDGVVTLIKRSNSSDRTHRWHIRIDHITAISHED